MSSASYSSCMDFKLGAREMKKEPEWKCDICKKPETIFKEDLYTIIGCKHIAMLKVKLPVENENI